MTLAQKAQTWADEGWNKGNLKAADNFFQPGFLFHCRAGTFDLQWLRKLLLEWRMEYPDLRVTVDDMVEQGDKLALRWTIQAGKKVSRGGGICHFKDGKAAEFWGLTTD